MLRPISFRALHGIDLIPQAIIGKPISFFETWLGAKIVREHDGLDDFQAIAFSLDGELQFAFKHYNGYPADTTAVYLPREFKSIPEISHVIAKILDELHLPTKDVRWQRSDNPEL
jgi:hypothetical protein